MFPEKLSLQLIELVSDGIDPAKSGAAIEIGVGTDNFYSLLYKKLGYHTIAVDPVAYPPFTALAEQHGIIYDESCIYTKDGEILIYTSDNSDYSSLYNNWWGIDQSQSKAIKSQTLKTFANTYNIHKISFLKVDTEGSEYEILEQFKYQPKTLLPQVLEFEYGGGGLKKDAQCGWAPEFFSKSLMILELLKDLDYQQAVIFDSVELEPIVFSFNDYTDFETLFQPDFEYGNIIAFKQPIVNLDDIKKQLHSSHDILLKEYIAGLKSQNLNLYMQLVKKNYPKRVLDKLKRIFQIK